MTVPHTQDIISLDKGPYLWTAGLDSEDNPVRAKPYRPKNSEDNFVTYISHPWTFYSCAAGVEALAGCVGSKNPSEGSTPTSNSALNRQGRGGCEKQAGRHSMSRSELPKASCCQPPFVLPTRCIIPEPAEAEEMFVTYIKEVMTQDKFLIVSIGNPQRPYVQFRRNVKNPNELCYEAVSNEFLDPALQLTEYQIAQLRGLGFEGPDPNYRRTVEIAELADEQALRELVRLSIGILCHVYRFYGEPWINFEFSS